MNWNCTRNNLLTMRIKLTTRQQFQLHTKDAALYSVEQRERRTITVSHLLHQ